MTGRGGERGGGGGGWGVGGGGGGGALDRNEVWGNRQGMQGISLREHLVGDI